MILNLYEETLLLQRKPDRLSRLIPVVPGESAAGLRDVSFRVDDLNRLQIMPRSYGEVESVVGRCHLDGSGTELGIDHVVGDHRESLVR